MMTRIASVTFFVVQALLSLSAGAQKLAPLPVEDAISTRSFGQFVRPMQFSPDGKWLAYVVTDNRKMVVNVFSADRYARTGVIWSAIGADILVLNVGSGQSKNVTQATGNNWFPVWSPDSASLAFLSDRDGSGQAKLWVWDFASSTLKKISDLPIRTMQQMQWLPDGKGLLLTVLPANVKAEDYLTKSHVTGDPGEHDNGNKQPEVFRSIPNAGGPDATGESDPWPLSSLPVDLAIIDVTSGKLHTVVSGLDRLGWYLLSPDGTSVAFSLSTRFETPATQQILWNIDVVAVATGERSTFATDIRMSYGGATFSWAPDSSRIAFQTTGELEKRGDCYVVDIKTATSIKVTAFDPDRTVGTQRPPLWDPKSNYIYFVRHDVAWRAVATRMQPSKSADVDPFEVQELAVSSDGTVWSPDGGQSVLALTRDPQTKQSAFYAIDIASARATKLMESKQCHSCLNAVYHVEGSPSGFVAYFSEDAQHPADLWLSDAAFHSPRRMTHLNPQFDDYVMGAAQLLNWRTEDGEQIRGALLLPAGYQKGQRYPLITWVYGGDFLSDQVDRFGLGHDGPFNLQLFATRGFAVLLPDAPQHLGTPMTDLAKTVLPGINETIELGVADPDRIGVMGHSYGGYSTMCLLVQSTRFRAAIVSGGFGDLIAGYGGMGPHGAAFGTALLEQGQGIMGGTPWQFRDRYIENSPIFYLDRIQTPILIVHGSKDSATLPFLADELFVDLRRLGKNVEYAKYIGEEHTPSTWSYENQIDVAKRWIAWFDKYLTTATDTRPNDQRRNCSE